MPPILLTLLGCNSTDCPAGSAMGDDGLCHLNDDSGTTATDTALVDWITPPAHCEPPAPAGDPVSLVGQHAVDQTPETPWLMELTDIVLDLDRGLAWGGGQGGVVAFDVSDPADVSLLGYAPDPSMQYPYGRYYHLITSDNLVYATNRDEDLHVFSVADPTNIQSMYSIQELGLSGLAVDGDRLYVVSHTGDLVVYDLADPVAPSEHARISGMGNAWKIALEGDRGFIADNTRGIVTVSLTDPPAITGVAEFGGSQDLALGDGVIYAASGGDGVVVLDAADPDNLVVITSVSVGTSIQSVSVDGDRLWVVDQESVRVLDISDPTNPVPLASEQTEQWAMHVAAEGGLAYVADWGRMSVFATDDTAAPDLDLSDNEVALSDEAQTLSLAITNHGTAPLSLAGMTTTDDRLTLRVDRLEVAPGESAALEVDWPGGEDLDATLCIASNDGDTPQVSANLFTGIGGSFEVVGKPAPDFTLSDLDGNTQRLSDQLGSPVVLVLFMPG